MHKHIALAVATKMEFDSLYRGFSHHQKLSVDSFKISCKHQIRYTQFTLSNTHVGLYLTGAGKLNAALGATALHHKQPLYALFSVGTAGSLNNKEGLLLGHCACFFDVELVTPFYTLRHFPGTPKQYLSDTSLISLFQDYAQKEAIPYSKGLFVCGDKSIVRSKDHQRLLECWPQALAVDMESAALADAMHRLTVPFFCLRWSCDAANEATPQKFLENSQRDLDNFSGILYNFLAYLDKRIPQ